MTKINSKNLIVRNARIIDPARNIDAVGDIGVMDGIFTDPGKVRDPEYIDASGLVAAPGFIDLHVHLRQPGNTAAETIATGTAAAAAGGFTSVVAMPNTTPATDSVGTIELLHRSIAMDAAVKVHLTGAMTKGLAGEEMSPIGSLANAGVVALTDDGRCVQNNDLMRHIVEYAKSFNLPILDHCEEKNLMGSGVMHEGIWSLRLGVNPIPAMSESLIVARDILLSRMLDWPIHIQHISCRDSIILLRDARRRGIKVTAEATPHHISLTDENVKKFDTNYKMNPPLRSEEDRLALIEALADGTVTAIATDHAPHTETAKQVEFDHAPFGIIGLETAIPVTFKILVRSGVMSISDWIRKFTVGPAEVLRWRDYSLAEGNSADMTLIDPDCEFVIDPGQWRSKSRNSPFGGMTGCGRAVMTIVCGRVVYSGRN